jgi:hypothetical protein
MSKNYWFVVAASATMAIAFGERTAEGQHALGVVSYSAGSTAAANFMNPASALGSPSRFTGGSFPSAVSPFSPSFQSSQIVSIGEGGQLTLQLSNYAVAQAGGLPELGVFSNVGIADTSFPNGVAGSPASGFGINSAAVEVSQNGTSWVNLGSTLFDVPTNGFTDLSDPYSSTAGNSPSDFQQPFVGSLSSFNGLQYTHPSNFDVLDLLAGSGGGKWLDISSSGLAQIGYVRFSIADDGNANTSLRFQLDAVSVSHAAFGTTVPEPTVLALLITTLLPALRTRCVGRRQRAEGTALTMPKLGSIG